MERKGRWAILNKAEAWSVWVVRGVSRNDGETASGVFRRHE
jgi:hypothetical protein